MAEDKNIAPDGAIWMCGACGKTNKNRREVGDESCYMNSSLVVEGSVMKIGSGISATCYTPLTILPTSARLDILKLLDKSWEPIHYEYSGLTKEEQSCMTEATFNLVIAEMVKQGLKIK